MNVMFLSVTIATGLFLAVIYIALELESGFQTVFWHNMLPNPSRLHIPITSVSIDDVFLIWAAWFTSSIVIYGLLIANISSGLRVVIAVLMALLAIGTSLKYIRRLIVKMHTFELKVRSKKREVNFKKEIDRFLEDKVALYAEFVQQDMLVREPLRYNVRQRMINLTQDGYTTIRFQVTKA